MKAIAFNIEIFDALIRCGFHYCYSKTILDEQADQVNIYLTPTYTKPQTRKIPFRYDTYFNLLEEPRQMATGIDGETNVFVNLDDTLFKDYYE